MKAIHNPKFLLAAEPSDVINHKTTKFEAIHNKASRAYWVSSDVINHKTTKFESNSQHLWLLHYAPIGCNQSQNYKI